MRIACFSSAMLVVVLEQQRANAMQLEDSVHTPDDTNQVWLSQLEGSEIIKTDHKPGSLMQIFEKEMDDKKKESASSTKTEAKKVDVSKPVQSAIDKVMKDPETDLKECKEEASKTI